MAETPIAGLSQRWSIRLSLQVLLITALISAAVATAAGFLIARSERGYIVSLMDSEHAQKLELLIAATLDNLISEDVPQIETSMNQLIHRDRNVVWVELKNETGKILYRYPKGAESVARSHDDISIFKKKIVFDGENFGDFTVIWDRSAVIARGWHRAFRIALGIGAVCFFLGILVYVLIRIFLISPLQKISGEIDRIQTQEYIDEPRHELPKFVASEVHKMDMSVRALRHHLLQRERREAELVSARQNAEAANRSKSEFLANISHELRTPLNAVIGFSEMMSLEVFGKIGDRRYIEYVRDINHSGNHLLGLINDLLDISRIEAGKLELNYAPVDIAEALDNAISLVRPVVDEKKLTLTVDIAEGLPEISADAQRLQQILINLLANAAKFTDEGGELSVSASCEGGRHIVLTIADNGIGIMEEDIERLLRPFEQAANAFTRDHEGTGLGLPITHGLVKLHAGAMRIESRPNHGTKVEVRLPLRKPGSDGVKPEAGEAETKTFEAELRRSA